MTDEIPFPPTVSSPTAYNSMRSISRFRPSVAALKDITTTVKYRDNRVCTSATTFNKSAVLHTQLKSEQNGSTLLLRLNNIDPTTILPNSQLSSKALWLAVFPYFATGRDAPETLQAELVLPSEELNTALMSLGARRNDDAQYTLSRSAFFQLFSYASEFRDAQVHPFPYLPKDPAASPNVPLRPPKPAAATTIYSRLIPHLSEQFTLQVCGPDHLDTLHEWLNDPRVDEFWEEKGSLEQHKKFIDERTADAHTISVIGSYIGANQDGEVNGMLAPATYSEIYWVKEDRLGPLMSDVRDYDRGIHMLVGSGAHRGPHRIRAWMPSLVHYCFLADPRTERVVAEPNAKNAKIIKYLESVGFKRHGDVQFPHKTAALMIVDKRAFYELCPF